MHVKVEVIQNQVRTVHLLQCLALQLKNDARPAKAIPVVREVVQGLPGRPSVGGFCVTFSKGPSQGAPARTKRNLEDQHALPFDSLKSSARKTTYSLSVIRSVNCLRSTVTSSLLRSSRRNFNNMHERRIRTAAALSTRLNSSKILS